MPWESSTPLTISGPATPAAAQAVSSRPWMAPDLVGAEQVAQVGRDRGEAAAVEADDDRGEQHEQPDRASCRAVASSDVRGPCRRPGRSCRSALRPMKSDVEDQTNRPAMLNSDSRPTKPAAAAAAMARSSPSRKKSWIIGLACSRMPMPAVTLQNSTVHSSQNCGVLIDVGRRHVLRGDQRLLLDRRRVEAVGPPVVGGHPDDEGAEHHEDQVDQAEGEEQQRPRRRRWARWPRCRRSRGRRRSSAGGTAARRSARHRRSP